MSALSLANASMTLNARPEMRRLFRGRQEIAMKAITILRRAARIVARIPERKIASNSQAVYEATFERMLASGSLDPLAGSSSRNSYHVRRAALHFVVRRRLIELSGRILKAGHREDFPTLQALLVDMVALLNLVEGPLKAHPAFFSAPTFATISPWHLKKGAKPVRGVASKRHSLGKLPHSWRVRVWAAVPAASAYRDVVAALCLCPARPVEFASARDDGQPALGVLVEKSEGHLAFTTKPAKSHGGKYGSGESTVTVAIAEGGAPAEHLAQLCDAAGGAIRLTIDSTDALRKAISRAAKRIGLKVSISPYSFRAQWVADAKCTFGAGDAVAAGAGHISLRSQSNYGRVEHGRRGGGGLVSTHARRPAKKPTKPVRERLDALKANRRGNVSPVPK